MNMKWELGIHKWVTQNICLRISSKLSTLVMLTKFKCTEDIVTVLKLVRATYDLWDSYTDPRLTHNWNMQLPKHLNYHNIHLTEHHPHNVHSILYAANANHSQLRICLPQVMLTNLVIMIQFIPQSFIISSWKINAFKRFINWA